MMKESIVIKNFGPIKNIEIDNIRPLTVFIGESGSGKSTIMKVVVLFRWIYKMLNIRSYLKHANISQSPFKFDFRSYLKNNGIEDYLHNSTEIIYIRGNITVSYKYKMPLETASIIIPESELSLDKMSFIADKRNIIPDILAKKAEVKGFYLSETYKDFLIASGKQYVPVMNLDYFGVKYFSKKTSSGIEYFIESIDEDKKHKVSFEDASSGMQTVTPLSVIVEYFSKHYNIKNQFNNTILNYLSQSDQLKNFRTELNIGEIKHKNIHIHIEEPELSLYPESQRSLINFIVNRCFVEKHNDYNMTVMMATHSPYIINHLNLLIKAYDKDKLVEGAKISYDDLAVYQVDEGEIVDLKMENERLINTNPLSDTINNIYDEYERL